jgi:hypothetical protein
VGDRRGGVDGEGAAGEGRADCRPERQRRRRQQHGAPPVAAEQHEREHAEGVGDRDSGAEAGVVEGAVARPADRQQDQAVAQPRAGPEDRAGADHAQAALGAAVRRHGPHGRANRAGERRRHRERLQPNRSRPTRGLQRGGPDRHAKRRRRPQRRPAVTFGVELAQHEAACGQTQGEGGRQGRRMLA